MSLIDILGGPVKGLVSAVGGVIDDLHTSDEEKLAAKTKLAAVQAEFVSTVLDYEQSLAQEQGQTIRAEATGHSWLQRNWRPIVMLWLAGLVGAHWLGFTPANLPGDQVLSLLGLVKIGLGGYVVGRSAEKVVPQVVQAMKAKEQA